MDYIQFFTLFGTMLAGFAYILREFKSELKHMKDDLRGFENEIRSDVRNQASRSDQLYTMFIDLLKQRNERTDP